MLKRLAQALKIKETRVKILLTLLLLFIFRLGCAIPVPGIDASAFAIDSNSYLGLLNSLSGGSLSQGAFLALGVTPYINASIIIQLLTYAIPSLQRLAKDGGEQARKKINLYTRIAALALAFAQAIGIVLGFGGSVVPSNLWAGCPYWLCCMFIVIVLVAGAMFTVWLGERITDLGIGNGLSLLIFVGILSSAGASLFAAFSGLKDDISMLWQIIIFFVALILIFGLIVFMDSSERKVPVQYAKQIRGNKVYGGQSTNIPIRVNAGGVMPIIFASALLTFPQLIISIFWPTSNAMIWYNQYLGAGSYANIALTAVLILFFAWFYSQMTFDVDEISRRMQANGGYIPGIRPGATTKTYLKRISNRITLFGAIFLAFLALVPNLVFRGVFGASNVLVNAFSATGLLILVSVALEFDKQLESQLLMKNYKGFLK